MRKRTVAAVAVAAAAVGAAAPAVAQAVDQPHVVTHVTGTPTTGFHVTWRDGSRTYTPTRSEALAECGEYGRATRRAACTAATYTAYRDLTTLKRSLRYAQR